MNKDQDLLRLISRLKGLQKSVTPVEGLTGSESSVVEILLGREEEALPGAKINELANELNVTSPGVTQLVTGLERKGFVQRTMDQADRRSVNVLLTDEGRAIAQRAKERRQAMLQTMESRMGREKVNRLFTLLNEAVEMASAAR